MAKLRQRRGLKQTREALLDSAQKLFTSHRYEDVRLKDIASDAGVDAALIARHFQSKAGLFTEVMEQVLSSGTLTDGPRATFARRMAEAAVHGERGDTSLSSTLLIALNIGSPEAGPIIHAVARDHFVVDFASWIGGSDAKLRAQLIISLLSGVGIGQKAFGSSFMTDEMLQQYVAMTEFALKYFLDSEHIDAALLRTPGSA